MFIKDISVNNEKIIFSLVQYPSIKGDIKNNLNNHVKHIKLSAESGADIVIFPELSLTGYELELASKLTVTPAGILIGNFPILDIFNPPINKYSKEPHHRS